MCCAHLSYFCVTSLHNIFILSVDAKHSYGEDSKQGPDLKPMHGPIYILSNSKHNYSEPPKHSDLDTKNLKGPVYMTDEYKHHYNQIHEHLDTLKELKAPVYETEGKSHYNEIIQHVESLQSLKGPVYDLGQHPVSETMGT